MNTIRPLRNVRSHIKCEHCRENVATHTVGTFPYFVCKKHTRISEQTLEQDYCNHHGVVGYNDNGEPVRRAPLGRVQSEDAQ